MQQNFVLLEQIDSLCSVVTEDTMHVHMQFLKRHNTDICCYIKHVKIMLSCQLKRICTLFLRKPVKALRSMVQGNIGHHVTTKHIWCLSVFVQCRQS